MTSASPARSSGTATVGGDAIVLDHVTKRYGEQVAVEDLSLSVRTGEVYGLLGPNGAGKTTTLRILLGLVRPDAGSASILGGRPGEPRVLRSLGSVVEEPAMYPYLSGRANLAVLARYAGRRATGVDAALDLVGLLERADDRVSGYSLGMRQRLGVAAALLDEPRLLVLDEPTNGLDPQGMARMRELIRELGSGDRTVLVSSHLLGEVEQMCDRVAVLRRGRLVAEDHVGALRGGSVLRVVAEPVDLAVSTLHSLTGVDDVQVVDGRIDVVGAMPAAEVNRALVGAGVAVSELRAAQRSLEDVFMSLTGEEPLAEPGSPTSHGDGGP